ncbi:hypothetical protein F5882DRAFT_92857 [Hyaloscypha sp. PMI_1271]|nr:hypothetical protein F5882DRAFT_92857 [Hyaloscypha sp. PMI_1271]
MINITINRNRLQTFSFRISSLSPDDDSLPLRRFSNETRFSKHTHHITERTYPWRHSIEISQIEIHAYLFRFLFSIPHTSVLIPLGTTFAFGLSVCLASIRSAFLLGCIWYFAWRGWSGQHGRGGKVGLLERRAWEEVGLGKCSV